MRSRTALVCFGGAIPSAVLLANGCRTPTQITLELQTNVVCADSTGVDIVAARDIGTAEARAALSGNGSRFLSASTSACTEGPAPRPVGTLVLTPSGSQGAVVVIAAFGKTRPEDCTAAHFAPECIIARRRFAFIDNLAVTLPLVLDPQCAGIPCNESSTCVGRKCVDSNVDCSSGTCTEPGISPDGGLIEVDGSSPILDGASVVDAADASSDATGTTEGGTEAGPDASDAGGDGGGGGGLCPLPVQCIDMASTQCTMPSLPMCCYGGPATSCSPVGGCPSGLSACCRNAGDCTNGDICCASTMMPTATTQIVCKSVAACAAAMGQIVCSTLGPTGCQPGHSCAGGSYTLSAPSYFRCS